MYFFFLQAPLLYWDKRKLVLIGVLSFSLPNLIQNNTVEETCAKNLYNGFVQLSIPEIRDYIKTHVKDMCLPSFSNNLRIERLSNLSGLFILTKIDSIILIMIGLSIIAVFIYLFIKLRM